MNFLGLLLGLAILLGVLFQTVLKDKVSPEAIEQKKVQTTKAFQVIKDAEKLKQQLNSNQQNMDFDAQMKNH